MFSKKQRIILHISINRFLYFDLAWFVSDPVSESENLKVSASSSHSGCASLDRVEWPVGVEVETLKFETSVVGCLVLLLELTATSASLIDSIATTWLFAVQSLLCLHTHQPGEIRYRLESQLHPENKLKYPLIFEQQLYSLFSKAAISAFGGPKCLICSCWMIPWVLCSISSWNLFFCEVKLRWCWVEFLFQSGLPLTATFQSSSFKAPPENTFGMLCHQGDVLLNDNLHCDCEIRWWE